MGFNVKLQINSSNSKLRIYNDKKEFLYETEEINNDPDITILGDNKININKIFNSKFIRITELFNNNKESLPTKIINTEYEEEEEEEESTLQNIKEKIITVSLLDLEATDFDDNIPQKIKDYAILNNIKREKNVLHTWKVIEKSEESNENISSGYYYNSEYNLGIGFENI